MHGGGSRHFAIADRGSRSSPPLAQKRFAELQRTLARVAPYLECPITRGPLWGKGKERDPEPGSPTFSATVLASDGYLYDEAALRCWADRCVAESQPLTSPVSREVLRPEVTPALALPDVRVAFALTFGKAMLDREDGAPYSTPPPLPSARPPFSPLFDHLSGTAPASRWGCQLGVVVRMLLGWDDGDAIEWCFPVSGEGNRTIATPPPARELVPFVDSIMRWLGLRDFRNPHHILTAWFRPHKLTLRREPGRHDSEDDEEEEDGGQRSRNSSANTPYRTMESLLVALGKAKGAEW